MEVTIDPRGSAVARGQYIESVPGIVVDAREAAAMSTEFAAYAALVAPLRAALTAADQPAGFAGVLSAAAHPAASGSARSQT
jgi:hypothetical protein